MQAIVNRKLLSIFVVAMFLMSMAVFAIPVNAQESIVPDPSFESNPRSKLHKLWTTPSPANPVVAAYDYSDSYTGRRSVKLSAVGMDEAQVWTKNRNPAISLDAITSATFWFRLLEGSHSPYLILRFKITGSSLGSAYNGMILILVSWQLNDLSPNGWTQYTNDDWHYLVQDPVTGNIVVDDMWGPDPFSPADLDQHHTLATVQGFFNGKLIRGDNAIKIAVGFWGFERVTALVDELAVNV